MYIFFHTCLCVWCVCMFAYVGTYAHVYGKTQDFKTFLQSLSAMLIEVSQLNPELVDMTSLASQLAPLIHCFCLLSARITCLHTHQACTWILRV